MTNLSFVLIILINVGINLLVTIFITIAMLSKFTDMFLKEVKKTMNIIEKQIKIIVKETEN